MTSNQQNFTLLQAKSSKNHNHIPSTLRTPRPKITIKFLSTPRITITKNGSYADHAMLTVILRTLRQSFPAQLLFQRRGPCDI
jgi:hypothetical protein